MAKSLPSLTGTQNTTWRKGPDGSLMAPRRGSPPIPPEGYEPSPGNPYVVRLKLKDCQYRVFTPFKKGPCCGGRTGTVQCTFYKKPITRLGCYDCDSNPTPPGTG